MRFEKLDLNLLVALDTLITERNITRAADKLHLSQSAMSNALGRLRSYFGDPLLVPVQRRMELTPRALALKDPLRDVLVRIRATIEVQPEFDPTRSDRVFKVFASDYTLQTILPQTVALAAAQNSTAQFRFLPLLGIPSRALESGDADVLVIPQVYCSDDHPTEKLLTEEFVCVVWSASEYARTGLSLTQYRDAEHVVMVPIEDGVAAYEGRFMQTSGMSRKVAVTTYSFSSMPLLVVGTPYVATVHSRLAQALALSHPLCLLPCPVPIQPMTLVMQWHEFRSKDPGIVWLRSLMQRAIITP